jgi:HEAT repeat protein
MLTSFTMTMNEVLNYFRQHLFTEQMLFDIIIFFIFLIITSISFIFIYLFRKKKQWRRKVYLQNSLNSFIGEIAICESETELNEVFSNADYQKVLSQFRHTGPDRNLMISELAETSKKFRGVTMENILWLFEKMDLEKQLLENLKNKKWHKKAKAIQQLAYLKQKNSIKIILQFVNHQNDLLRMEAQIALVKMTGFEGLEFLNKATYPVSEWQQLRLIEELSSHKCTSLDKLREWLKSENLSVVNFALRLVEIYQQYDFYEEVKNCLSHPSMLVCKNAISTLSNISNETTADLLITHFARYDSFIQIKILKILQADGTENQLPFLLSILNHPDDSYKLEAAKAILKISDTGMLTIEGLIDRNLFPWNVILSQIKNVA